MLLTREEALEITYSEDPYVKNIFIEPPNQKELSDEDFR